MEKLFTNKTLLISGGLGDIGRAIILAFAEQGANISFCDLKPSAEANEFLSQVEKNNVTVRYKQIDITDPISVKEWIQETEKYLGIPNIIIANAATVTIADILQVTPEQWSQELKVNLDGGFYITQMSAKRLVESNLPGYIVIIGSWAASTVHQQIPAYCVSKAGLRMLCKCLALELAPYNIMVNEIAPGYVEAGLSGRIFEKTPGLREKSKNKVPVRRLITAEEVATQVLNLCSPDNKHITGTTLLMDGGLSLLS